MTLAKVLLVLISFCLCSCMRSTNYNTVDLGDGYALLSDNNNGQIIQGPDQVSVNGVVPYTVVAFAFDSQFIIVKQKAYANHTNADILKAPEQYWIIVKNIRKTYGPFNADEFENSRDKLNIAPDLKLYQ